MSRSQQRLLGRPAWHRSAQPAALFCLAGLATGFLGFTLAALV
ncbi:MAG: hypothetical protein AAFQ42_10115 [Pseudomonadota bacterium]